MKMTTKYRYVKIYHMQSQTFKYLCYSDYQNMIMYHYMSLITGSNIKINIKH